MELTDFNTAKLLFEKGFNVPTNAWYHYSYSDKKVHYGQVAQRHSVENWNGKEGVIGIRYNCPTLDQVCRWLRDAKGLHVSVRAVVRPLGYYWSIKILDSKPDAIQGYSASSCLEDHDLALSAGITQALKMIECR